MMPTSRTSLNGAALWSLLFHHFLSASKQSLSFYFVSLSVWLRGGNHQWCLTFTTQAGVGIDVSAVNSLHLSCGKAEIAPINVPLGHTHIHANTHTHPALAHTPSTAVLQQTRIYGTIIVKHHDGRRWGWSISSSRAESPLRCCISLELHFQIVTT